MIKQAWDYKSTVVKKLSNVGGSNNSQGYEESYYKVIDKDAFIAVLENLWMLIAGVNGVIVGGNYANYVIRELNSSQELTSVSGILDSALNAPNDLSIAFSYSHKPITCIHTSKYNNDLITIHYPEGDWSDRYFYYYLNKYERDLGRPLTEEEKTQFIEGSEGMIGEMNTYLYSAITPISKEEFEALITNK